MSLRRRNPGVKTMNSCQPVSIGGSGVRAYVSALHPSSCLRPRGFRHGGRDGWIARCQLGAEMLPRSRGSVRSINPVSTKLIMGDTVRTQTEGKLSWHGIANVRAGHIGKVAHFCVFLGISPFWEIRCKELKIAGVGWAKNSRRRLAKNS